MRNAVIIAGAAAIGVLLLVSTRGLSVPGQALTLDQVRSLARKVTDRRGGGAVTPEMVVAIASIESGFNPTATRFEPHLPDFSVGLMQTLVSTAQWVWDRLLRNDAAVERPSFQSLLDPETSMIFAVHYLRWLRFWNGINRDDEFVVRGYNGGPGGATSSATAAYFQKYLAARARFG